MQIEEADLIQLSSQYNDYLADDEGKTTSAIQLQDDAYALGYKRAVIALGQADTALDAMRRNGLSIDGDNAYKRDLIDTIIGAMAFGFHGTNAPPPGHWGQQFWDIGRAQSEAQKIDMVPPPLVERFCFCGDSASLQMVSGGAAPCGYLGEVTLLIGSEYVRYYRAGDDAPSLDRARALLAKVMQNHVTALPLAIRAEIEAVIA